MGAIVGTPRYMAPEQAAGQKDVTTAIDIYSLGAILYEMLLDHPPFQGETPDEILRKVVQEEAEPPHKAPGLGLEQARVPRPGELES